MNQIVFFDIDNTLWRQDQIIPESAKHAIRALKEKGNYAFINSGRARGFINDPTLLSLGFDGIVGGCGCYVEIGGEILRNDLIPQGIMESSIAIMKENGLPIILEGWKHLYVDPEDFRDDPYYLSLQRRIGDELFPIKGHSEPWEINKFSVNYETDAVMQCVDQLEWYFDFILHGNKFVEIVPKGHSKATGMYDVCNYYGIPIENTFAVGDSMNDMEMLKAAGCAIVMGDGSEEAKAVADYVTDTLENDGIEKALRHYNLI